MPRVTVDGKVLEQRVWWLLDDARAAAGLPPGSARVIQGSWSGVAASAGTHMGGGAVDLSIAGLSPAQQLALVAELRKRNVCAWIRHPDYGWPASAGGPHVHGIVRDEWGLSGAAAQQVRDYDNGLNGLASRRRDPHPRPIQRPTEEVALMAWKVNARRMVKTPIGQTIGLVGGRWSTVATIALPKGGSYSCTLQVRMPKGVGTGEARLARLGWGTAKPGQIDDTGHNPIPPASAIQRWRTPIQGHNIVGGGPLAYQVWLPENGDALHKIRIKAKAVRTA